MDNSIIYFAAIDIGSNAARLLISGVNTNNPLSRPEKSILLRYPLRLGEDVFSTGEIGKIKVEKTISLMKSYKHLMRLYNIVAKRACATSAMREAKNGLDIVNLIKRKTDIDIEIIDGKEEANIIYESHIADVLNPAINYMYVDVGGGSTEISFIAGKQIKQSKSFNIGTLRLLSGNSNPADIIKMSNWVADISKDYPQLEIIGSGGNINKIFRLAQLKQGDKLTINKLINIRNELMKYSVKERIVKLHLRPDRADVIIPASEIFMKVAEAGKVNYINVPTIGLADGIIYKLYEDYLKRK